MTGYTSRTSKVDVIISIVSLVSETCDESNFTGFFFAHIFIHQRTVKGCEHIYIFDVPCNKLN